ncbi:uncharacterized protein LOC125943242 [Dermacentor silvarum]|uniref:uncharacterized protein LOC125943242 n=1 Tax=Dermacentor silvarum TaxID=543639 RepID=UPI002101351A|nr:uncharacterized protein LOC125943242 [Dermacentor silvarum]
MQNIHNLSQQMALKKIAKVVSADVLATIQSHLIKDDHNDVASVTMRSSYCRHKYYKTHFQFVPPSEISLGLNKQNLASVYHYVPIESLIQFLMSSAPAPQPNMVETSFDLISGQVFKQSQENEIQVVLYQDEFEIANPLGSARGNFKLLGVYMTLGNLPLHCRLQTASMQLVMLCRQRHVKEFSLGQVLRPLTEDLVRLEATGMIINGVKHNVRLSFIVGDNLGSHAVGGFTQNFSTSVYFCRYCLVRRSEFQQMPHVVGERRTPENYNEALERLAMRNTGDSEQGIVCNSPFHALKHFHVCKYGLPPCIGHDLFEGVVRLDLALYLKYFVKQRHWFTYDYLNHRIAAMKYSANDVRNKPAVVSSQGDKLTGHAIQIWTFLRLLPLYIGNKIADRDDPVWELVRMLAEIVDVVMATKITLAQVAYLKVLVEEYLTSRIELFPLQKLKPKHHYMLHYSELIEEFGPLVHVWTMKFEGKHQYFKECIRSVRNFKNVTKTLSEKHQLYQFLFSSARLVPYCRGEFVDMSQDEQHALNISWRHSQILHKNVLLKKAVVNRLVCMVGSYVLISDTKYDVTFGLLIAVA